MAGDPRTAARLEALLADARRYDRYLCGAPAFVVPPPVADGVVLPRPGEAIAYNIADRDAEINAFVTICGDLPDHGIPIAVKDVYDVAGLPTTAGSRILSGRIATEDAAVVRRLRAAGAVIVGKTATHEFAYGCTTDSPFHGPTRNPADLTRTPGGSSGGSAAAVAAGMVPIALGTDTAGSVRIPAACCGVVGFKPTYGKVSTEGIIPLSWSLDHPGTMACTVADIAWVHAVLTGETPLGVTHPRIGVPSAWLETRIDPDVRSRFTEAIQGLDVAEVELPPLEEFHFVSRVITLAEAGSYHQTHLDRLPDYAPDVRARVELGQVIPARDYLLAQRMRAHLIRQMATVMEQVDVLVMPTLPLPAPLIGERRWEGEAVADALTRFTAPFNVTGQPAISLPCGMTSAGLPVGLQLVGASHQDAALLGIAEKWRRPA
ncbi:MAG TPA: amidase [Symbiobacteriaceae bacterium]|nr:amidase [Symbiobacteriaceae bacterium]